MWIHSNPPVEVLIPDLGHVKILQWLWNHQSQQLDKFHLENERVKHEVVSDDEDFSIGSKVLPSGTVVLVLDHLRLLVLKLLSNRLRIFHIPSLNKGNVIKNLFIIIFHNIMKFWVHSKMQICYFTVSQHFFYVGEQ